MQVGRLLEPDDNITIGLPSLLTDVPLQMLGESHRREVWVGAHLLIVRHTEGNDVLVGGQNLTVEHFTSPGVGFAAQQQLDFLRDDRPTEDPGERVTDRRLELALDAVD
ncbi:hypothetical protein MPHL43072_01385 [Mycolicibacterium phlei DSM 43072]|nr:hypothetical protein MPHLEI_25491 [Mycolicibacterium phlei RIVM601174]KXW59911.1 hypothetical protein MPHL43070_07245 [Mycolicibacterium phlei DSM 43070]KXW72460.1 hypothetical protein MPHL43072_01385 [Mycolicibacterium phlei DSM 43072]MBF4194830.1 hypothetical protein [Mycolicibacterium phlei]